MEGKILRKVRGREILLLDEKDVREGRVIR